MAGKSKMHFDVRAGAHGGDMITAETFNDFDLKGNGKFPAKSNNG